MQRNQLWSRVIHNLHISPYRRIQPSKHAASYWSNSTRFPRLHPHFHSLPWHRCENRTFNFHASAFFRARLSVISRCYAYKFSISSVTTCARQHIFAKTRTENAIEDITSIHEIFINDKYWRVMFRESRHILARGRDIKSPRLFKCSISRFEFSMFQKFYNIYIIHSGCINAYSKRE